jgi:hypothetical protein
VLKAKKLPLYHQSHAVSPTLTIQQAIQVVDMLPPDREQNTKEANLIKDFYVNSLCRT